MTRPSAEEDQQRLEAWVLTCEKQGDNRQVEAVAAVWPYALIRKRLVWKAEYASSRRVSARASPMSTIQPAIRSGLPGRLSYLLAGAGPQWLPCASSSSLPESAKP